MDDKNEEVLKQYDLKIHNIYRARGALLLDTNKGLKLYGPYTNSNQHLEYENNIRKHLMENGYKNVDIYVPNKEGHLISENNSGEKFVVKNWFSGDECNLRDGTQAEKAAKNLAIIHKGLNHFTMELESRTEKEPTLLDIFKKHNRELKRVRSYVLDKKQKNEFEVRFLSTFEPFFHQGLEAENLLETSEYNPLRDDAIKENNICHGSYTYHNILFTKDGIAATNFDKAGPGIQICDLYYFLRKAMEKNNWNLSLGSRILESYLNEIPVAEGELNILYILMLYPEKFWKITNYYFNNKKSWISSRNIQKLVNIQEQDKQKNSFLQELKHYGNLL